MDKDSKKQWMQSFDGKIRVGPNYQALIPPFCRAAAIQKKCDLAAPTLSEASSSYEASPKQMGAAEQGNISSMVIDNSSSITKTNSQCLHADDFLISK